jgi:transposase
MMFPESTLRVFVYGPAVDMRKSFDGLRALVKHALGQDPLSGHVFVFVNRRGDFIKALYWDRSGFCLWAKRLQQGRFARREGELNWTDWRLWLDGIELDSVRRKKRFSLA